MLPIAKLMIASDAKIATLLEEAKKVMDPGLAKDPAANATGLYELVAVLSHEGRSLSYGAFSFLFISRVDKCVG